MVEMLFEILIVFENCFRDVFKICWKDLMVLNFFILIYWFMDVEIMIRKFMMIMIVCWKFCFRDVLREILN